MWPKTGEKGDQGNKESSLHADNPRKRKFKAILRISTPPEFLYLFPHNRENFGFIFLLKFIPMIMSIKEYLFQNGFFHDKKIPQLEALW